MKKLLLLLFLSFNAFGLTWELFDIETDGETFKAKLLDQAWSRTEVGTCEGILFKGEYVTKATFYDGKIKFGHIVAIGFKDEWGNVLQGPILYFEDIRFAQYDPVKTLCTEKKMPSAYPSHKSVEKKESDKPAEKEIEYRYYRHPDDIWLARGSGILCCILGAKLAYDYRKTIKKYSNRAWERLIKPSLQPFQPLAQKLYSKFKRPAKPKKVRKRKI